MYFFSLLSHFSLPSAPPLLFIFLFLFFLFSWKRNCYAQSAIRLFRRCYPEHRNADVPVFSTLWIKFPLHSIFFFFFFCTLELFCFSSNFVSSFRLKRSSSLPFSAWRFTFQFLFQKFQTIFHRFRVSLH